MTDLTTVIADLKQERNRLASQLHGMERAIKILRGLTGGRNNVARRRRRRLSKAARARIAAAQRARWAKVKAGKKR